MNLPIASLWFQALEARWGIYIKTSDPQRLRALLYSVRRELKSQSPEIMSIAIRTPPDDPKGCVWLLKEPTNAE